MRCGVHTVTFSALPLPFASFPQAICGSAMEISNKSRSCSTVPDLGMWTNGVQVSEEVVSGPVKLAKVIFAIENKVCYI